MNKIFHILFQFGGKQKSQFWVSCLVVGLSFLNVAGQTPTPSDPHIAPIPNPVSYHIQIQNKKTPQFRTLTAEQANAPNYVQNAAQMNRLLSQPVLQTIIRQGDKSFVRTEYSNKDAEACWNLGHIIVHHGRSPEPGYAQVAPDTDSRIPIFTVTVFYECLWAQKVLPTREETRDGISCYFYTQNSSDGVEKLWIDKRTSLPVARENDVAVYSYKFDEKPAPVPLLPAEYEKNYDLVVKNLATIAEAKAAYSLTNQAPAKNPPAQQ